MSFWFTMKVCDGFDGFETGWKLTDYCSEREGEEDVDEETVGSLNQKQSPWMIVFFSSVTIFRR